MTKLLKEIMEAAKPSSKACSRSSSKVDEATRNKCTTGLKALKKHNFKVYV